MVDIDIASQFQQHDQSPQADGQIHEISQIANLGRDNLSEFDGSAKSGDIESAINLLKQALSLTSDPFPGRFQHVHNLAISYYRKFERYGSLTDLDAAISRFQEALASSSENWPERHIHAQALGYALFARYRTAKASEDLQNSWAAYQEAIDNMANTGPALPNTLAHLARVYINAFEASLEPLGVPHSTSDHAKDQPQSLDLITQHKDLESYNLFKGVDLALRSVELTQKGDPLRAQRLAFLALASKDKYLITALETDRTLSVKALEEAIDLQPNGPMYPMLLNGWLGYMYQVEFEIRKNISHSHNANRQLNNALMAPSRNQELAVWLVHEMGYLYGQKFDKTGSLDDLEMSISFWERCLEKSLAGSQLRQHMLQHLGHAYVSRWSRLGAMADHDAAISAFQEGIQISPAPAEVKMSLLMGLGEAFTINRGRNPSFNLSLGIEKLEEGLSLAPQCSNKLVAETLHALASAYLSKYDTTAQISDADRAIELSRKYGALVSQDKPKRANYLTTLSGGYLRRHINTNESSDLEMAISASKEACSLLPSNHPMKAFVTVASALPIFHTGDLKALAESNLTSLLEEALDSSSSDLMHRIVAGTNLAEQYMYERAHSLAFKAAEKAVSLVPRLAPRSLRTIDKQRMVLGVEGAASNAAALALEASKTPYEALRLLELGRGVLRSSLGELRTDVSELGREHPALAEEYTKLRDQLDSSAPETLQLSRSGLASMNAESKLRFDADQELEQVLLKIRQQPRFERFLLPPSEDQIKAAATSNPIVVINVSRMRCDALIVTASEIKSLWLPRLSMYPARLEAYAKRLDEEGITTDVLEWLWNTVAKPVLGVLGYDKPPQGTNPWPRICWIPTRSLARFPIHAAGLHTRPSPSALIDCVISTYATSIQALVEGQAHQRRGHSEVHRELKTAVLIKSQQNLPFVSEEIAKVADLCNDMKLQTLKPQPKRSDVLDSVRHGCHIFHFAGHGSTDPADPLKSALILADGHLTVASLLEINIQKTYPFLAYLSACGTGRINNPGLVDEGFHLIAACKLAGFQNVIGTLWKVHDKTCVEIATRTYSWIGRLGLSPGSVSESFHHACREVRDQWVKESSGIRAPGARDVTLADDEDTMVNWAPFVIYSD